MWDRIKALLSEAHERTLGALMETMERRRRERDAAMFSIALIALSAKMAKADGVVTDDEVAAFRTFFAYPESEEAKVRTVFTLAMEDVGGFESYARQVARLFRDEAGILEDVLDCLFFVALADGILHPNEVALLDVARQAFDVDQATWRRVKAAHIGADHEDPYVILGVPHDIDDAGLKAAFRALAKEHHPDALVARGVPEDLVKIAEHRMAVFNDAYGRATKERGMA